MLLPVDASVPTRHETYALEALLEQVGQDTVMRECPSQNLPCTYWTATPTWPAANPSHCKSENVKNNLQYISG